MNEIKINLPDSISSIKDAFYDYEQALIKNNLDILDDYFWASEFTVRYGVAENLYGYDAIYSYRRQCQPVGPGRTLKNTVFNTFGDTFATVSTEFRDGLTEERGRQMQSWVKFDDKWKIVAAHVSIMQK